MDRTLHGLPKQSRCFDFMDTGRVVLLPWTTHDRRHLRLRGHLPEGPDVDKELRIGARLPGSDDRPSD